MSKRISKRVREEAADALAADSSVDDLGGDHPHATMPLAQAALAAVLAVETQLFMSDANDELAEAAALLRDGWRPGDPVRRLKRKAVRS